MKVLIINNDFRVYWKSRLAYLHTFLAPHGVQLSAIELFGKGSPYFFDNVNTSDAWWSCIFPHQGAGDMDKAVIKQKLFAAIDEIDPDVIIAPSIVFYAGALGIAWARKHNRRFIMFDDARPAQVKRNFIVQWVKDTIIASADAFWLPAPSYDQDHPGLQAKDIHFFYGFSCIDNNRFRTGQYEAASKTIICVARLVPIKNFEGLLAAWKTVEAQHPDYKLLIIGDGPERSKLEQLLNELKLTSVTFSPAIDNASLPQYFAKACAFVLASFSETWGLAVNEAMAAGLPVLLSKNINASRDLLRDGFNGYSFDPYNQADMTVQISRFIGKTDQEKLAMSEASLQLMNEMSFERMGTQLLDALNLLMSKPAKRPGIIAEAIISRWHGRYNTAGWDKL